MTLVAACNRRASPGSLWKARKFNALAIACISHGKIRGQNPADFAARLAGEPALTAGYSG